MERARISGNAIQQAIAFIDAALALDEAKEKPPGSDVARLALEIAALLYYVRPFTGNEKTKKTKRPRRWGHRASVASILASALTALRLGRHVCGPIDARPRRHQPLQEDLRRRAHAGLRSAGERSAPVRRWRARPDPQRPAGGAASRSVYIRSPDCTRQDMLAQSCTVDAWPACSASAIMYPG